MPDSRSALTAEARECARRWNGYRAAELLTALAAALESAEEEIAHLVVLCDSRWDERVAAEERERELEARHAESERQAVRLAIRAGRAEEALAAAEQALREIEKYAAGEALDIARAALAGLDAPPPAVQNQEGQCSP